MAATTLLFAVVEQCHDCTRRFIIYDDPFVSWTPPMLPSGDPNESFEVEMHGDMLIFFREPSATIWRVLRPMGDAIT